MSATKWQKKHWAHIQLKKEVRERMVEYALKDVPTWCDPSFSEIITNLIDKAEQYDALIEQQGGKFQTPKK